MYTDVIAEIAHLKDGRIHVARAGLVTQARLCVDMFQQGRGVAWVVKNRDELLTARALIRLFSPELSSGDFLPDAFIKVVGRHYRRFLLARSTVRAGRNVWPPYTPYVVDRPKAYPDRR